MKAIEFPEQNMVLRKPDNMTDEECGSLAAFHDGTQFVSCWKPDEEDIERLKAGEPIWLWIVGQTHPPVSVTTISPFTKEEKEDEHN